MTTQSLGLLFKKKNIKDGEKTYEIFMFRDFVAGFSFTNTNNNKVFHVFTGNYAGTTASQLDESGNEFEDVVVLKNLDAAIKDNDNSLKFNRMREKIIAKTSGYYIRSGKKELSVLVDKSLISMANQEFLEKTSSDFDEDEFGKTSDISSMYSSIKKTIVSQDEQIMMILTALFKNQKVVNSNMDIDLMAKLKENLLIYGSTGTGKTEILKRISRLYKIPIVIQDATSLSETGYQGRKIQDMLIDLLSAASGNLELAEKGILVIDEFDKLAEKERDNQTHVSRIGVQRGLLKLLDGTEFYFDNKKFNTAKLTVVGIGAFTGIVKDTNGRAVGFGDKTVNSLGVDNYKNVTSGDFISYGIIRELIGRFSKFVAMNPLKQEDIAKILIESDFSPLNTYKKLFDLMEIGFEYSEDFVNYLAERASKLNSGARSLKTIFDECISGAMFRIFAGEYSNVSLVKPKTEEERPYVLAKKQQEKRLV